MGIRTATLKDFDELLFIEEQAHNYPWPESTLHWCLEQAHIRCFLLEENRDILGFAIYECVLDEASLLNIAVNPLYQGQGLGKKILQNTLLQLEACINKVFLEVRISNAPALHIYQRTGFIEVGQRRNYYPSETGREDARIFNLDLAQYRQRLSNV